MKRSLRAAWRSQGTLGLIQSARDRLTGTRSAISEEVLAAAAGGEGLEIGGPSARFRDRGMLPVYNAFRRLDNVNYSADTLWGSSRSQDESPYVPASRPTGVQYLREATDLSRLPDNSYDVILSSHCLEHIANPLRALNEWQRVCRPDGFLCLILPHRDGTFDRKRLVTPIEHYRSDEHDDVGEDDDTHFEEVIRCHDLRRDPGVSSALDLQRRVADNQTIRGVHHHVFNLKAAVLLVSEAGWTPLAAEARRPHDILILAAATPSPQQKPFQAILRGRSPFKSDR